MSAPIDNVNLSARDARTTGQREQTGSAPGAPTAAGATAPAEDQLSLSGGSATVPDSQGQLSGLDAARRAIETLRQHINADPTSVLDAQGGLNSQTTAGVLSNAAA